MTGYGYHEDRHYKLFAEKGWMKMEPAFAYRGLQLETALAEGKEEQIGNHKLGEKSQFVLETDYMAECVQKNQQPFTPGEEGLQDQRVMEAIYQSARAGRPVKLPAVKGKDVFQGPMPDMGT